MSARSLQAWDLGVIHAGDWIKTGRTHSRAKRDTWLRGGEGEDIRAAWEIWDDGISAAEPWALGGPIAGWDHQRGEVRR